MSRTAFIGALRDGLRGMTPAAVNEIVADYEDHFTEGAAAGRSEADIAAALGDPTRLARELRAEAGLKRWETERNPSAAASAVFAVLGLGAIDIIFLLPILMTVVSVIFAVLLVVIALFVAGVALSVAGMFGATPGFDGTPLQALLAGVGLMAGSVSLGALQSLIIVGLVNALVWYARLHYRLLKPAIDPQGN
jgi:uncharacterized membrane protein